MKLYCAKDYEQAGRIAANILAAQIIMKPDCVLGLATGSTPVSAYENLIRRYEAGDLDFSPVHSINLDEYRGLDPENDQSYRYFMNTHLFNHINIDKKNTFVPDGMEADAEKACQDYDEIIRSHGGIDLQLLGLGHNGHIESKKEIIRKAFYGPITPQVPASVLQLHPDVTLVGDEAALI